MGKKLTRVNVDGQKIKEYVYKSGETMMGLSESIGIDNGTLSKYLKTGDLPKIVYAAILAHYGIKNQKQFLIEEVQENEKRAEENKNLMASLNAINEKLEKLEFINKNICECSDYMEKFIEGVNAFNETVNNFIKAMQS